VVTAAGIPVSTLTGEPKGGHPPLAADSPVLAAYQAVVEARRRHDRMAREVGEEVERHVRRGLSGWDVHNAVAAAERTVREALEPLDRVAYQTERGREAWGVVVARAGGYRGEDDAAVVIPGAPHSATSRWCPCPREDRYHASACPVAPGREQ
jgi:hypothetical protein